MQCASGQRERGSVCLKTLINKFLAMRGEWRGDRMASVQREAEVGCQDNAGAFVPLRGNKVECRLRCVSACAQACACVPICAGGCWCVRSYVCQGATGRGLYGYGVGGVVGFAAEAAGRTPASLLAPGAPLLSK